MSWMVWALISLVCMGVGNFFAKLATVHGMSTLAVMPLIFLVNMVLGVVLYSVKKPDLLGSPLGVFFAVLAGLGTGLGLVFLVTAFSKPGSNAGVATAIMNTNFALVALLSFLFLRDTLTLKQMAGLAAILGGIFLLI